MKDKIIETNVSEVLENFDNLRVPLSAKQREKIDKIYPYYGAQSIIDYVDDFIFDGEYILVAEDGENLKSQKSKVCNLVNGKFWVNNHAHILKAKNGNNTKYLCYYLNLIDFKPFVTGSAQPKLTKDNLNSIPLKIHSKPLQKQIAKVLSDLDTKIEVNNKINQELEAMAKTLYDYWFVQFDFPDKNGKPYKSSGGKMVYNEVLKREIPEGWEDGTIGVYCKSSGGYAFKSSMWNDQGISVVKIKDIQEDYTINLSGISYADLSGIEIDERFISKPGNVLIAMTGATVGKYAIVPYTEKPLYVNQRVGYFDLGSNPTNKLPFLINSLNQKYFREQVFKVATGAAQPNISNDQINNIKLVIPKKYLLELYNSKMKSSYDKILNNQRENQKLSELRDWLLPMLMNGQVTVQE